MNTDFHRIYLCLSVFICGSIFCLLIITSLEAQERGVEVTLTGKELIETEPRRIVTTVFLVTNKTSEKREFTSHVKLPEGWTLITRDFPFELGVNESDIRLVSFFIPQAALAGTYEIPYLVKERDYPSISDFCNLYVTVLPVTALETRLLEAPKYIIAGDAYQASFVVTNGGNIRNTVSIKVHSEENLPFIVDTEKLQLLPGESKRVTVTVKTDAKIKEILRHRLALTVQTVEDEQVKAQATSYVETIPRMTGVGERFHRIPVKIITSGHASRRKGKVRSGFQTEISGAGTLDEEGKRYVEFLFREPDIRAKSILGKYDEYRFNFQTEHYGFDIGDNNYRLSPLTEDYRYGQGVKGKLSLNNFSLGAYYQKARWIMPERKRVTGYMNYLISQKYSIGLNYLRKINYLKKEEFTNVGIVSLHGRLRPTKNTDVELEYASGEGDYAHLLRAYGYHNWISYYLKYIHAEPDYPGYYRDIDSFSAGIAVPFRDKLRLNARFGQTKNNLDLDTAFYSARLERHYQFGLNYRFATGFNLSLEYKDRSFQDRLPLPKFDYDEKTCRLGVDRSFKKLTLNTSFEFGKSRNNLTSQNLKPKIYTLSTYFRPTKGQLYSGYIRYSDNGNLTVGRLRNVTAGLNGSVQIDNRTSFNLTFQRGKYLESDFGDTDHFWIELIHTLRNRHEVSVRGYRTSYRNSDTSASMVEYTVPFGLPVSRKKGTGMIKGHVHDEESKEPIPDVILRLDRATAVTDENGHFTFPFLKPHTYYLNVNTARIGMNLVTAQKTPMQVIVEGGKETFIEIGIARSAALSGRIMVYGFENGNGNSNGNNHYNGLLSGDEAKSVKLYGLANIFVELVNGQETERRVTDEKGRFSFEELRPGKWTLKAYDHGLPEYHYLEKDTFEFELKPSEKRGVLVKVLPKKRRIHIIEEGGTILEEEKKG